MASKLGISLAAIGTAGAPVAGYFVYRHLSSETDAPAQQQQTNPVNLEPKTSGSTSYVNSNNFKVGQCSEKLFKGVDFKSQGSHTSTTEFDLEWGDQTGDVEACLILHLKYQEETKALAASTELAATQGNKGFVMWTTVLGKSSNSSNAREEVRLVVLEKTGDKWDIKKGFTWLTQAGSGTRGIKIKVSGESKEFDNEEGKIWEEDDKKKVEEYKKHWSFKGSKGSSESEGVFTKLEVKRKDDKASALFGNTDHKLLRGSFLYGAMNQEKKWSPNLTNSLSKDVQIPFKDIKGKWSEETN